MCRYLLRPSCVSARRTSYFALWTPPVGPCSPQPSKLSPQSALYQWLPAPPTAAVTPVVRPVTTAVHEECDPSNLDNSVVDVLQGERVRSSFRGSALTTSVYLDSGLVHDGTRPDDWRRFLIHTCLGSPRRSLHRLCGSRRVASRASSLALHTVRTHRPAKEPLHSFFSFFFCGICV